MAQATVEPVTDIEGTDALKVVGSPIEVAAAMLDIEADETLPDEMRAQAAFMRLVGPSFFEGMQVASRKVGQAEAFLRTGEYLGAVGSGFIMGRLENAPPEMVQHVAEKVIMGFCAVVMAHVEHAAADAKRKARKQ